MSIDDEIKDRCQRRMLYPLLPISPGATIRRAMFVAEPLWDELNSPEGDLEWEERIGYLWADLENFVTAREIEPKYLFLLYPAGDCIWEIRSRQPSPSVRVLGLFAVKDRFIATNYALRSSLGGWQSREWKAVKRAGRAVWRWLFPAYDPVETTDVSIVVTGAINGKYFKHME
jgi:hypothetical protein